MRYLDENLSEPSTYLCMSLPDIYTTEREARRAFIVKLTSGSWYDDENLESPASTFLSDQYRILNKGFLRFMITTGFAAGYILTW
jgi:hypothetical protein